MNRHLFALRPVYESWSASIIHIHLWKVSCVVCFAVNDELSGTNEIAIEFLFIRKRSAGARYIFRFKNDDR